MIWASLIHPNQKFSAIRAHPCHESSPQSNASLLCYFLNLFPGEPMPCKQSTHSGCWDLLTGYMVLFSGRVPVNTYRGFPGPGPQYKSRQHRLGISSLSCWVGPVDSPSPVCSKSLNVVWTVLHEMLKFRAIFLNESSIAIHCQTTLQRRSGKYAELCPGSADIMIVLVFTIFEPTAFSREA